MAVIEFDYSVPERYRGSLETFPIDAQSREAHARAKLCVAQFAAARWEEPSQEDLEASVLDRTSAQGRWIGARTPSKGILLEGPTGTGKSTLLGALLGDIGRRGVSTAWVDWKHLCTIVGGYDYEQEALSLERSAALVVDDLGGFLPHAVTLGKLAGFFEARYSRRRVTFFATNLNVKAGELDPVVGVAIGSRISESCERIALVGEDRRRMGRG